MRGTLAKRWGNLACEECSPNTRHKRRCPKLGGELRTRAEAKGWTPLTAGPGACPTLAVEADEEVLQLLEQHAALDQWGAWPHSPGDRGAQSARWAEAMRVIRAAHSAADAELKGG